MNQCRAEGKEEAMTTIPFLCFLGFGLLGIIVSLFPWDLLHERRKEVRKKRPYRQ
jgi:NADH:ubiquinone oxidoreductase subunit 3 (subunit A)